MSPEEIWLPIEGWGEVYEVSSLGRVRSLRSGNILAGHRHPSGHVMVRLTDGPRRERIYLHRIVAAAFLPNPQNYPVVRHLKDDPSDNRACALAWGTYSDNRMDMVANGIHPQANKTHCKNGHEFTDANTRTYGTARYCRKCNTETARKLRKAKTLA